MRDMRMLLSASGPECSSVSIVCCKRAGALEATAFSCGKSSSTQEHGPKSQWPIATSAAIRNAQVSGITASAMQRLAQTRHGWHAVQCHDWRLDMMPPAKQRCDPCITGQWQAGELVVDSASNTWALA